MADTLPDGEVDPIPAARTILTESGVDPKAAVLLRVGRFVITGRLQFSDAATDIRSDLALAAWIADFFLRMKFFLPTLTSAD